jgi:hypothetical protein
MGGRVELTCVDFVGKFLTPAGALICCWPGHGDDRYTFPLWKKIVAGGISGCIGAAVASPTGARHPAAAAAVAGLPRHLHVEHIIADRMVTTLERAT